MNERQRDLFMWRWSHKRQLGIDKRSLLGALMGAIAGLVVALILGCELAQGGAKGFDWLLGLFRQLIVVLALAVPGFALLGWVMVRRVYASQERLYQQLLASGVPVPAQAPALTTADRWPAILVTGSMLIIAGLVLAAVISLG
ncbi:MAG: hypothetical protein KDI12_14910 [Anaerolineae bacterium]|nr:hypothetical protein [Anaerolineae bacterium]